MHITPISAEAVLPLRQAILRPGRPLEDAVFPHDTDPETVHFGAFVDEELVGVASVYHEPQPGRDDPLEWRLRGMAVTERMQRQGIGSALLRACVTHVREQGGRLLWFNARTAAVPFYRAHGFAVVGEEFEIPDVGPHFVMRGRVGP